MFLAVTLNFCKYVVFCPTLIYFSAIYCAPPIIEAPGVFQGVPYPFFAFEAHFKPFKMGCELVLAPIL